MNLAYFQGFALVGELLNRSGRCSGENGFTGDPVSGSGQHFQHDFHHIPDKRDPDRHRILDFDLHLLRFRSIGCLLHHPVCQTSIELERKGHCCQDGRRNDGQTDSQEPNPPRRKATEAGPFILGFVPTGFSLVQSHLLDLSLFSLKHANSI